MKSKASFFNFKHLFGFSGALFKENMRRFWALPVLGFLGYFLTSSFLVMVSDKDFYLEHEYLPDVIESVLNSSNPAFIILIIATSVIASICLFRYLNIQSSVAVMHSMPFKRGSMYWTNFVSGLTLIIVPFLLNVLILYVLALPFAGYLHNSFPELLSYNLSTFVLRWLLDTIIAVIITFALCVLASILSGNFFTQFCLSFVLLFIGPVFGATLIYYFNHFLYGFSPDSFVTILETTCPLLKLTGYDLFSIKLIIIYIILAIFIIFLSNILYQIRKLERATESIAFNPFKPVIAYIITFIGMTLLAFFFTSIYTGPSSGTMQMYFGFLLGALITFIICQMIIEKSPKVFNLRNLKGISIYFAIFVLFITGLHFDMIGYSSRIPSSDKIESVKIHGYNALTDSSYLDSAEFTETENIEAAKVIHENLTALQSRTKLFHPINFESLFEGIYDDGVYVNDSSTLQLSYLLKNGKTLDRVYSVNHDFLMKNQESFATLLNADEVKNSNPIYKLIDKKNNLETVRYIPTYWANSYFKDGVNINTKEDMESFIKAYIADWENLTLDDILEYPIIYGSFETISKDTSLGKEAGNAKEYDNFIIYKNFVNTNAWLTVHGYMPAKDFLYNNASYAVICKDAVDYYDYEKYSKDLFDTEVPVPEYGAGTYSKDTIPVTTSDCLVIADRNIIQYAMENRVKRTNDKNSDYWFYLMTYNGSIEFYIDEDKLPPIAKEHFKDYNKYEFEDEHDDEESKS